MDVVDCGYTDALVLLVFLALWRRRAGFSASSIRRAAQRRHNHTIVELSSAISVCDRVLSLLEELALVVVLGLSRDTLHL